MADDPKREHEKEQEEDILRDFETIFTMVQDRNPSNIVRIKRSCLFRIVKFLCWQCFRAGILTARKGPPKDWSL
jgi:hypothetical protein